ncbi:MAG TPA: acyl-CoA dehydrogenase, partial [Oligoflexia bacterium]|nr:acyl-CoA dehydrogenase [Oligoflexia bacterium]
TDDSFLFNQGATKGLGKIQFHDYRTAFESVDLPSVKTFRRQIAAYKRLLFLAGPSKDQIKDFDFLLIFGELFTLVAYGQLIIEQCQKSRIENDLLDQIFDFMVRDFSHFALRLYAKPSTTRLQAMLAQTMIRKPSANRSSFLNVWQKHVHSLRENYEMKP